MKNRLISTASVAICLALPVSVFAAKGDKKHDHAPAANFEKLDANGDGSVSEAEYVAAMKDKMGEDAAKARFAELDKDHDGKVTKTELNSAGHAKREHKPKPAEGTSETKTPTDTKTDKADAKTP